MYGPKDVSGMLNIPPSSLRRYSVEFSSFLSENARQEGKKRRYTEDDINVLRRIRRYTSERKTDREIAELLRIAEAPEDRRDSLALIPTIAAEFETIRAQLAELRADRASDRAEIERLTTRLHELEKERDEERRLGFWQRLFGKRRE